MTKKQGKSDTTKKRIVNKVFVKKAIGNQLKALRNNRSLSIEDFATITDIAPHVIVDIENGEAELYIDEMSIICKEFKVKPEYFFEPLVDSKLSMADKKILKDVADMPYNYVNIDNLEDED